MLCYTHRNARKEQGKFYPSYIKGEKIPGETAQKRRTRLSLARQFSARCIWIREYFIIRGIIITSANWLLSRAYMLKYSIMNQPMRQDFPIGSISIDSLSLGTA